MSVPRVKRLNRKGRLAHAGAKNWLVLNKGAKNLVHRYRSYFGVDLLTAALELRALGAQIPEAHIEQLRSNAFQPSKKARKKKTAEEAEALERQRECCWPMWSDEPFPFPVNEWEHAYTPHSPPPAEHEMGPCDEEWAAIMEREDDISSVESICHELPDELIAHQVLRHSEAP